MVAGRARGTEGPLCVYCMSIRPPTWPRTAFNRGVRSFIWYTKALTVEMAFSQVQLQLRALSSRVSVFWRLMVSRNLTYKPAFIKGIKLRAPDLVAHPSSQCSCTFLQAYFHASLPTDNTIPQGGTSNFVKESELRWDPLSAWCVFLPQSICPRVVWSWNALHCPFSAPLQR